MAGSRSSAMISSTRAHRGDPSSSYGTHLADGRQFVIDTERHQRDGDVRDRSGVGREALAHQVELGQPAGLEFGIDGLSEFGLAGALMGERQQPDHGAAGSVRLVSSASKARR